MRRLCLPLIAAALLSTPAHALDGEAFVAAFGEACVPERLSYDGTLKVAEGLGWRPLVTGENADYDRFIAHSDALLAEEIAEEPDLHLGSDGAWLTRDIGGRPHLLAVSMMLTEVIDTVGCHLYDFQAQAPIDPAPVTRLLDRPVAYAADVDPALLVSTVWGPPPGLPRTLDTHLTFVPQGSPYAAETGFSGLMLKFSTSSPSWDERQE